MSLTIMDNQINTNLVLENSLLKNRLYYYLYQKGSKILNVLYVISSFIPTYEPLSKEIKTCGINLLKDITQSFKGESNGQLDKECAQNLTGHLHTLISFLDLALKNNYLSQMNHQIIRGELLSLIELLSKTSSKGINQNDLYVKQIDVKDTESSKKTYMSHKDNVFNESKPQESKRQFVNEKHSQRRKLIINIIKTKGQVTIKDISSSLSDCSEKTLQRELLSLISEGAIQKEGERRWSKYSLTQS